MLLCLEVAQKTLNSKGHFVSRSMPLGPLSFRLPLVPPPLFRRFLFVGDDIICQPWRINFTSRIKDCGILLLHQINTKYIQLSSIQYIFWYCHQYWIFLAYAQIVISIKYFLFLFYNLFRKLWRYTIKFYNLTQSKRHKNV